MNNPPAALATHFGTRETTTAVAIKITRTDGEVFAFTSHDVDDTIDSVAYSASPGLDASAIVIAASAAVGNMELTTLHDGTLFTTADILGGVWRNAAFIIFRYNWNSISDGVHTLLVGTLGEFTVNRNSVTVELRDLRQYLQQPVGDASSKTCRARLGDDRCTKDLTAFTYSGTITAVTSNQVFRDAARAEGLAWFDEGEITFTSGPNAGIPAKVKSFAANGTFTLALPLYGTVAVGHTYTAIAGCRKRLEEDCRDKFDNVINFVGEPHRKGINNLTQSAADQ